MPECGSAGGWPHQWEMVFVGLAVRDVLHVEGDDGFSMAGEDRICCPGERRPIRRWCESEDKTGTPGKWQPLVPKNQDHCSPSTQTKIRLIQRQV